MAAVQTTQTFDVLLVEDNDIDAEIVKRGLKKNPHVEFNITHTQELKPAQDLLRRENFNIVLLDLGLPGTKGLTTLEKMLATRRDIPIIVLTGLDDHHVELEAIQAGAQDYLIKQEFNAEMIGKVVEHCMARHGKTKELESKCSKLETEIQKDQEKIREKEEVISYFFS